MKRRMPVPLAPGERGGYLLDAELPPLSREELDRILALIGGSQCPAAADGCAGDPCCPVCSSSQSPTGPTG